MPKNRFPDSAAKRELRRQDARRLATFRDERNFPLGLHYCGMPSVEFLDVIAWRNVLRSVCAVEWDGDTLQDMRIEWDRLSHGLPIHFVSSDILDFIRNSKDTYDVYNLDFYGGFLNPNNRGAPRCPDAIRKLIVRQAEKASSFVLITTFNVRDKGAREYLDFVNEVPRALKGWENVEASSKEHKKNNSTLLKLCFPYFCWQVGMTHDFAVRFEDPVVYYSSATMLHFYAVFIHQPSALPKLTSTDVLAELASRPLIRLEGMIPRIEMRPPEIIRAQ